MVDMERPDEVQADGLGATVERLCVGGRTGFWLLSRKSIQNETLPTKSSKESRRV